MNKTKKVANNFYALLEDNVVRRINLLQGISLDIRTVFLTSGQKLLNDNSEEIQFDGNHIPDNDEVLFVKFDLHDNIKEVATNPIGIPVLNLTKEHIKAIFWYEESVYYFQNFDNRKLLRNRSVILYNKQTYTKLEKDAFIVDNIVNAIYKSDKLYFNSYANANKLFSLIEYYHEATNEDIKEFSTNVKVSMDTEWVIENSSSIIRKQLTLLKKNKVLETANPKKIQAAASKFKLIVNLDADGKIVFPNDKSACKDLLTFLNEQYFFGVITKKKYKANSKREA